MSAEPIAWCFRKSLVQKLQWHKPVGEESVLQHWTPLGDVSGLLAERDRLKAANAELAEALGSAQQAIDNMKTEAETAAQGDEEMLLDAAEAISNVGLEAVMAIRAALTKHQGATT